MSKITKLFDERDALVAKLEAVITPATTEARDFTPAEEVQRALIGDQIAAVSAKIDARRDADRLEDEKREDAKRAEKAAKDQKRKDEKAAASREKNGIGNVRVGSGPKVYGAGSPNNYIMDQMKAAADRYSGRVDTEAQRRLTQHAKEVAIDAADAQRRLDAGSPRSVNGINMDRYFISQIRHGMAASGLSQFEAQNRDLSTAAGSGGEFVPPIYLTEDYVPFARAGRVFANACHNFPLPPGTMSINIPKIQGGVTVSPQGTQNTNVSDTDLQTEYVTFPVITVAGAQNLSLQLVERSPIDFTGVAFEDLARAQAQAVDIQALNGTGSNGQVTGALNTAGIFDVTWATSATTVIPALMGTVANAKSQIASSRFAPATDVFFTPSRWEWIEQQVDSNNRPLIVPTNNGPWNVVQTSPDMSIAQGATGGRLMGLNVWQYANIPATLGAGANQDAIIVTKSDDIYLYETPVISRALPQTYGAQLTILIQLYNYIAFTAARYPTSVAYITGNALTNPPTFASE